MLCDKLLLRARHWPGGRRLIMNPHGCWVTWVLLSAPGRGARGEGDGHLAGTPTSKWPSQGPSGCSDKGAWHALRLCTSLPWAHVLHVAPKGGAPTVNGTEQHQGDFFMVPFSPRTPPGPLLGSKACGADNNPNDSAPSEHSLRPGADWAPGRRNRVVSGQWVISG